jgi:uracil-DNA glycosylase family 4
MDGRVRVLSHLNGPVPAKIMLVGEAPGRRGAEISAIPFSGDESGRRLDALIAAAGWDRRELFITNAVLCNPQTATGNNRAPTAIECRNCTSLLARQIEVINPRLVVALGAVALRSLAAIAPHDLRVSGAGQLPIRWSDRWLAVAYHPSARAAIHRSIEHQRDDFRRLGAWATMNVN